MTYRFESKDSSKLKTKKHFQEYRKEYYLKNKKKIKAYYRKYYQENKDELLKKDAARIRAKTEKNHRKRNYISPSTPYLCEKCDRVFTVHYSQTKGKKVTTYLDKSFPRRQYKRICPKCYK